MSPGIFTLPVGIDEYKSHADRFGQVVEGRW